MTAPSFCPRDLEGRVTEPFALHLRPLWGCLGLPLVMGFTSHGCRRGPQPTSGTGKGVQLHLPSGKLGKLRPRQPEELIFWEAVCGREGEVEVRKDFLIYEVC